MTEWQAREETVPMKRRCGACNAWVTIETDGTEQRLSWHSVGGHRHVPFCSASGSSDPALIRN